MKLVALVLFAVLFTAYVAAQQSATVKEPVEQCYLDLKANLQEVIRWDDEHMTVTSRPLLTNMSGNVQVVTRLFQEKNDTECKIVVAFESPDHSVAWNAVNSSYLLRTASLYKAKIESTMKAREKAAKKQNP